SPKTDFCVMEEEQKHGDILKLNILEDYRNLTLKTYGLISYADKYCKNVKCVVKMDSDVEGNVEKLEDLCQSVPDNEQMITGHIYKNISVARNISSKWYVPHYVYSDNIYRTFTHGPIYVLSGYGILPQMLKTVQEKTPFFNSENFRKLSEDIMFTGIAFTKLFFNASIDWWGFEHASASKILHFAG
uniref:Hexosyltransferase n=1 Tax=Acrobeloides nanus TaxID=290746 RepID=A0A914D6R6_9BILA